MGKLICVPSFSFFPPFVLRLSIVITLGFVNFPSIFAQKSAEKDSLLKLLKTLPEDTNKVNVLNRLCFLSAKSDPKNSLKYGKQSKVLAIKLSFKAGLIEANSNLGRTYRFSGEYDQAIIHKEEALKESQKIQDSSSIAKGLRQIGILHRLKGDFPAALKYYFNALKTYESINDKLRQGHTFSSIGTLYYKQDKLKKSLEFHQRALTIHKDFNDQINIAIDNNNLANIYADLKNYDQALLHYNNYKKTKERLGDRRGVAIALSNIGSVYLDQKKFKLAIDYCMKSIEIREQLGLVSSFPYAYLSRAYEGLKDYDQAIFYGLKARQISVKKRSLHRTRGISELLSKTYQLSGDYRNALKYYQEYKAYADSVFNETKSEQIAEMEAKYDTEKKEQENKFLKLQDTKNKAIIKQSTRFNIAAVIGVVLLIILAVVLYRSNLRKQETNKVLLSQKQEIEIQTEEILAQRDMLEEQHKDIKDSINYARKIQTAILPLPEEISAALPEHFLFYQPRDIVSGDFYWFAEVDTGKTKKFVISVSDCTGHGVPGAFMSMIGNDLLNDIVKDRRIIQPDIILDHLHEGVRRALHQETGENTDGMDISLCVIDPEQKTLSYAGANSPLVYVQNGEQTRVSPDKTSIGGEMAPGEMGFQAHTISYQDAPVMCYMYSDGYRDQFGGKKGKKFMRSRFLELVFYISQLSMQEQRRQVENTINDWMKQGGYEQMDDMLVMGFRLS